MSADLSLKEKLDDPQGYQLSLMEEGTLGVWMNNYFHFIQVNPKMGKKKVHTQAFIYADQMVKNWMTADISSYPQPTTVVLSHKSS